MTSMRRQIWGETVSFSILRLLDAITNVIFYAVGHYAIFRSSVKNHPNLIKRYGFLGVVTCLIFYWNHMPNTSSYVLNVLIELTIVAFAAKVAFGQTYRETFGFVGVTNFVLFLYQIIAALILAVFNVNDKVIIQVEYLYATLPFYIAIVMLLSNQLKTCGEILKATEYNQLKWAWCLSISSFVVTVASQFAFVDYPSKPLLYRDAIVVLLLMTVGSLWLIYSFKKPSNNG